MQTAIAPWSNNIGLFLVDNATWRYCGLMGIPMQSFAMTCISAVLLITPILPAQSDELPVLDVLPVCRGIISQGAAPLQAGDRSVTLKQCLDAEQAGRETMKNEWSTFSAADKKHCIAEATMGGESSYTELVTCLEMARDVRKLRMPPVNSKQID
ncbi:MAG: hypothetical protein WB764_03200 [Xanthobacteraceae bacterium]